jgi:hypothetical protein
MALERSSGGDGGNSSYDRRVFARNWRLNRGAQVAPRDFVLIEGALPQPCREGSWKWQPNPTHIYYVERFLSLAESRQIPVFWILTPAMAVWRARNEQAGTLSSHERFIKQCMLRFPGLTVLDGQHLDWGAWAFRDPIHLNRDGALRLTIAVGDSIAPQLTGAVNPSRWIELQGLEDRAWRRFEHLLEDLDQSNLAVNDSTQSNCAREDPRP